MRFNGSGHARSVKLLAYQSLTAGGAQTRALRQAPRGAGELIW